MSLHFIRPEWLLALLPLGIILWALWRQHATNSAWNRYIAPHLAKILVTEGSQKSRRPLYILAFSWFIAVLALAGPALNKQSLPVFAAEQGRVLVMDMSVSMFATDLAPNRLTQAKFRATDLLRGLKEGETGLIAFAGDAFTISPLTRDTGTLLNLLPTLSPEIMPLLGSNLAAALTQAKNLLAQGGHLRGDIIVMTDGITPKQFDEANSALSGSQYRLAIMGFGSPQGAPIRLPDGQLQRDSSNEVVVAKTDFGLLQKLADNHNGTMIPNRADGEDLVQLQHWLSDSGDAKATDLDGETWQDLGPYLALFLLIPALLSFKQGILANGLLMGLAGLLFGALPQNAHASAWDSLWHTQEQQAMQAYQAEDYANAAQKFETPQWQGAAQYKAGNFEQALKTFEQDNSANGLYNQGNALMQMGKPDKAKERYQAALDKQPDFPQAKANLELAEKLLDQQQSQQNADNQDQQSQGDQNQQGQNQNDQQQDQQSSQNDQAQEQSQEQQSQQQNNADQADEKPSQDQDTSSEQQDNAEPGAQDKQQDADKAQRDQQEAKNEQQQAQQEANQQNSADNNAEDNAEEQASNEAQMQAKVADDKSNTEQEQQALAQKADKEKQSQADKDTETAISETLEAPPSNSEPLPAEMQRALRGVSEDPQVLLRNKMQLEYQKRRQNGQISRDNEQW